MNTAQDLIGGLRGIDPGAQVPLTVQRGGARQDLMVTVGSRS